MVLLVFLMLVLHEVGHIVMGWYLGISFSSIVVYPFGIFADFGNLDEYPSVYEWYMAFSGPVFQVVTFILLNIMYQYQWLSLNQLDYYQMLNIQMCLFNLIPVYPLDGGRLLRAICMHVFPYVKAMYITYSISFIVCLGMVCYLSSSWRFLFVVLYMLYLYKELDVLMEKRLVFYYHRFIDDIFLPNKIHSKQDLYKDYHNIIVSKERFMEKQWLRKFFIYFTEK